MLLTLNFNDGHTYINTKKVKELYIRRQLVKEKNIIITPGLFTYSQVVNFKEKVFYLLIG